MKNRLPYEFRNYSQNTANFSWISCKRYWDIPIPSINDPRIEFDENILLG
jgi:hypothetical protein